MRPDSDVGRPVAVTNDSVVALRGIAWTVADPPCGKHAPGIVRVALRRARSFDEFGRA